MKSSIHLFYGIIIGILLVACTGQTTIETTSNTESIKQDKKEFEVEEVFLVGHSADTLSADPVNEGMKDLKAKGWTIIDFEIHPDGIHYLHAGK
jgi:hypothetical protein